MAYVRKVRTASGAVAVQVVAKLRGRRQILAHVGSAHTDAELGMLLERARVIALGDQGQFEFEVPARTESVQEVANGSPATLFGPPAKSKGLPVGPGRTAATSRGCSMRRSAEPTTGWALMPSAMRCSGIW